MRLELVMPTLELRVESVFGLSSRTIEFVSINETGSVYNKGDR
jgi:hypothetical protein